MTKLQLFLVIGQVFSMPESLNYACRLNNFPSQEGNLRIAEIVSIEVPRTTRVIMYGNFNMVLASHSICYTSPILGVGLRKTASTSSLLHCITTLITKEMDLINRSHDASLLSIAFHLFQNCCESQEFRVLISKVNNISNQIQNL